MRRLGICLEFLCTALAVSLLLSLIPFGHAGQYSVDSGIIYGTDVSCSVSYPDTFKFVPNAEGSASVNVSLSIDVTFNNQSISAVNITAVYVRLYPLDINLTQITYTAYPPFSSESYASADWLTTDEYPSSTGWHYPDPLGITREAGMSSGFGSIDQIALETSGDMYFSGQEQAYLYLMVVFCFLNSTGQAIWTPTIVGNSTTSNGVTTIPIISFGDYHWELFTNNGEASQVTAIYSEPQQQTPLLANPFFWIGTVAVVIIVIVAIVATMRKRKAVQKTDQTQPPPP